ncbi:MAG: type II toxin-antitoxin system VapC family toxin [Fimbriimonas sp.]|nr:type II toxin-antitoxin system VapC family toxin [Fimbriimonas sp.]
MRAAIDTNRLTDLFRGDKHLGDWLGECDQIYVPLPVLAEIKAGFAGGARRPENEAVLREFLLKPTVSVLLPGRETAEHYARLFVQLRIAGTPIPINDLWIAALVVEHDLVLVTRDAHFRRIPQIIATQP